MAIMASRLNTDRVTWLAIAKDACSTDILASPIFRLCPPANTRAKSPMNVPCRLIQNLYSSTGRVVNRLTAIRPLMVLRAVSRTLTRPDWAAMARSNTATTSPARNRPQPKRENNLVTAPTQGRPNISTPMLPMEVKNWATAS